MSSDPEQKWRQLATAARGAAEPAPAAPPRAEIRRRLEALQGTLRELFLVWLWRRWSLVAVVFAAIVYGIVWLLLREPVAPPRPELPLPPAP